MCLWEQRENAAGSAEGRCTNTKRHKLQTNVLQKITCTEALLKNGEGLMVDV